jgi:carboxypeptidase Taq
LTNPKLPAALVAALRETASLATHTWQAARAADDWARFAPQLDRLLGLQRRVADLLGPDDHPYDALLDAYEPGMRTADVCRVFADLRERTLPLVRQIAARAGAVDDAPLHQPFDEGRQWALARELTELFGYDYAHGRMDRSAHPFTTTFAHDDVRITVRVQPDFFGTCFFAAAHECGHALYNQGLPARFEGTPLRGGASSGLHESQSRLWENIVGCGRPFLHGFYPRLQDHFPAQLGALDFEPFYRAVNKSTPSLIRVEADEVTYNFHIMLRFDLEVALIEGTLGVEDLPARWSEKMEEYLGIRPGGDADGVMQDIHWGSGLFGYFPTYTLGNLMSVQLYEAAARDLPDLPRQIERGELGPLLAWMREHIHAHGRKFLPQELLERASGRQLTAEPYIAYLNAKFGELYGTE